MILKRILKKQNAKTGINSDQDRKKCQAVLKTAVTVRVSKKLGICTIAEKLLVAQIEMCPIE
jgi:hypothetical protein